MRLQQPIVLLLQRVGALRSTISPVTNGQHLRSFLLLVIEDVVTVVEDLQTSPMPKLSPSLGRAVTPQPILIDAGDPGP
jgi:hypothetical protein